VLSLGEKIREMHASAEKYADAAKQLEVGAKHQTTKQTAAPRPEAGFTLQPEWLRAVMPAHPVRAALP
jgi:hypothetical protein